MKRFFAPWSLAAFVCVLAPCLPAHGAGWVVVLKNTPAEDFNDEDIRQFLTAGLQLLSAETPMGEVAWNNAESGAGGHFKELSRTTGANGRPCRDVRLGIYSKEKKELFATWTVCKGEDGRWKVARMH